MAQTALHLTYIGVSHNADAGDINLYDLIIIRSYVAVYPKYEYLMKNMLLVGCFPKWVINFDLRDGTSGNNSLIIYS